MYIGLIFCIVGFVSRSVVVDGLSVIPHSTRGKSALLHSIHTLYARKFITSILKQIGKI